jgi:polyphosphate kinase
VRSALELYLTDNTSALLLHSDGQYLHPPVASTEPARDVQAELMEKLCGTASGGNH